MLPWDTLNTGPRTGHYYLSEDITAQLKQITINDDNYLVSYGGLIYLSGGSTLNVHGASSSAAIPVAAAF